MTEHAQLSQSIIAGDEEAAVALTSRLLEAGVPAREVLDGALIPGMETVSARMKVGEMYIPEVLLSARAMQACLESLRPHLLAGETADLGIVVIGTIEGDVHDIGKNLVAMMLEGAGFTVVNLGADVRPADFVTAAGEHGAQIVGMSTLLTTTMGRMGETVRLLGEAGLRDRVKVLVGGAPVRQAHADKIGADAYGANAAAAVERTKELLSVARSTTEEVGA